MKKRLVKIMAGFLIFAMILSIVSPGTAAIVGTNVAAVEEESQEVQENSTAITQKDIDQKSSETATEEKTDNLEKKGTEQEKTGTANMPEEKNETNNTAGTEKRDLEALEANKDSQQMEEKEEEKTSSIAAGKINFVYIESPYLETPGTQRIVIAFEKAISGVKTLTLTVKDESGKKENWLLSKQKDGVYLFEKKYSSAASGIYKAEKIHLIAEDKEETISLSNLNVQAEFGVNKKYEGIDELQPITNDGSGEAGASVAVIDENGTAKAQTSIAAALNEAQNETTGRRRIGAARSGKIMVALDPGHDANSIGAHANGLKEEELTLKIAKYCKEELEQYAGVEVYMTRTGPECPFNKASSDCIEDRVNAAADAGAQIFVSFHLNSFTSSRAKGAEVIVQNKNWRPAVASEGEKLAGAVLDELEKIGITKRATPIYSKNAVNNKKYADGSAADYYSVQRYSKLRNIPGIIIEHAFITNTEEVNTYLKTEAGLKKLGVADASGIAKYLGISKGEWRTDSKGNRYYYENGQKVIGEKKINGKWYYFDKKGIMKTGWHSFTNKKVYYGSDGVMVKGEKKIKGKWYFFEYLTGAMKTGWHSFTNKKVYYGTDGAMVKGEKKIDGKWYLFKESTGEMVTGWYDFPNKRVYYGTDGAMAKGETIINGKSYYFRESTGELLKNGFANHKYYGTNGVLIPVSQYGNIFYKISGNSSTTIQQMVRFYEKHSSIKYPSEALKEGGAATIEDFARIYYEEAKAEGIKVEVAWAQTMKETGWLKFGGQVKIEQYNFAGIGATDGGACGASFEDVRTGVRAQIQHLKAYASTDELKQSCVDPRFDRIKRGCAQYVEILGQKENPNGYGWATSENYGVSISKLIDSLKKA